MLISNHEIELREGQTFYEVMEENGHQNEFTRKSEAIKCAKMCGVAYININRWSDGDIEPVSEITL